MLADLAKTRLRTKLPEPRKALNAGFRAHHKFLVGQILAQVDFFFEQRQAEQLTRRAIRQLERLGHQVTPTQPATTQTA